MPISLESARRDQAEAVAAIIRASFAKQVELLAITQEEYPNYVGFETAEKVKARMDKGACVALAYLGNTAVGTVGFALDRDRTEVGYVERMAVLPDFRGRQFGNALLEHAENRLGMLGATHAELSIVARFSALQRFYERAGYVAVAKRIVPSLPFEVLFMEKRLRQGDIRAASS